MLQVIKLLNYLIIKEKFVEKNTNLREDGALASFPSIEATTTCSGTFQNQKFHSENGEPSSRDRFTVRLLNSYSILKTASLGELLLIANPTHLLGVYFFGGKHALTPPRDGKLDPQQPVLEEAAAQIEDYLRGDRTDFSLPLIYGGTPFQHEIWRQIALIPFGRTLTYTELAERAGAPQSVARGRYGHGTESAFDRHPLPPRGGKKRRPLRLCRRPGPQEAAAGD